MAPAGEREPVFALSPAAGDVDILIAAELMEAGRAVMRGFVTPDRTTLIASTHRTHAVSEKIVPGDGQAPEAEVFAAMETAAKRLIVADYQRAAVDGRLGDLGEPLRRACRGGRAALPARELLWT